MTQHEPSSSPLLQNQVGPDFRIFDSQPHWIRNEAIQMALSFDSKVLHYALVLQRETYI